MSIHVSPNRGRTAADLFLALVDNAAIFPPGNTPMKKAIEDHRSWQSSPWSPLVGPFICAPHRLDELLDNLPDGSALRLSLTLPGGTPTLIEAMSRATVDRRIELASVEIPASPDEFDQLLEFVSQHVPPGVLTYVELPVTQVDYRQADLLAQAGARLKLRTGGTTPSAFPHEAQLAAALMTIIAARLPFKLTAGLHHPIRHRDPRTGFEHHGFLNIITATDRAICGANTGAVTAALAESCPDVVADEVAAIDAAAGHRVRESFVSFGTCSVADPVTGLLALGLLAEHR